MNTLTRTLIQDSGYSNGFEWVIKSESNLVTLGSARHPITVDIIESPKEGAFNLTFSAHLPLNELKRALNKEFFLDSKIEAWNHHMLGVMLQRAAELGIALPDTPERKYEEKIALFLAEHPEERGTEAERITRRRIGQNLYREALLEYWGYTCAVTAINVQEVLRASHAKPWADCETDAERLNVYNGFLLSANYDALFDTGLITFNNNGSIHFSSHLSHTQIATMGIEKHTRLRWIDERHIPFLQWHRERVFNA